VAIPYVVALLLGIMVLLIAIYVIYKYVVGSSPLSCSECRAHLSTWCSDCYLENYPKDTGWSGGHKMSDELKDCIRRCEIGDEKDNCAGAETLCKGYIPL